VTPEHLVNVSVMVNGQAVDQALGLCLPTRTSHCRNLHQKSIEMDNFLIPAPFPFRTTHSISELCEIRFQESGWTGVYTTDIEDLAGALEEVYKLGLEDLSWVEMESLCVDANADVGTPSPLNALYPAASPPRIRIPSGTDEAAKKAAAIHRLVAQDMERPLVPRQVGRVFEEATNAQLRASLRVCGVIPQHEFHDTRQTHTGVMGARNLKTGE
jgi:hypothetical protein